jgi:hypothetical protein
LVLNTVDVASVHLGDVPELCTGADTDTRGEYYAGGRIGAKAKVVSDISDEGECGIDCWKAHNHEQVSGLGQG